MKKKSVHFVTAGAVLVAISYMLTLIPNISIFPSAPFLNYDPKDIVIAIGGLIWGPLMSFVVAVAVSILEMFTISATGPIGCIMNILSTCAFTCTASWIYQKKRTIKGATLGLIAGCGLMAIVMLAWNYLVTPLYMMVPREAIIQMLLPVFLPFNLLKGGINAAVTFILYKPIVRALRKGRLIEHSHSAEKKNKFSPWYIIIAFFALITFIMIVLSIR